MVLELPPSPQNYLANLMELYDPKVIKGFRFCATMDLDTPLRTLRRHGEFSEAMPDDLAADNLSKGIWLLETKTFRELGFNIGELPRRVASSWGQIPGDGGDVYPFLLRFRELVETVNPVSERRLKLIEFAKHPDNERFFRPFDGGIQRILKWYLPRFIDTLPYLTTEQRNQLEAKGILSANQVLDNLDALRALKGIGEKRIAEFRKLCEACATPDDEYIDKIIR